MSASPQGWLSQSWLTQSWKGHLIALLAGGLVTLSLAPFNVWPLGIVSCALLAWQLNGITPVQALWRGWWYGLGLFGSGSSWVYVSIHVYGYVSVGFASFLTLLFVAGLAFFVSLPCYLYARWVRDLPYGMTFGFASLWVLTEWWRSWFLTGFPWLYLGYAHLDTPLSGWAPVTGIYGLSFIVALSGAIIALSLTQKKFSPTHWITLIAIWVMGTVFSAIEWVSPADRPSLKVAMVQTNIAQEDKWKRSHYVPTLELYQDTSAELWPDHDLVIWPEAAIPNLYQRATSYFNNINRTASDHNSSLITGIPYVEVSPEGNRRYNSVMGFGMASGVYHKQHLVPFGEYVPLQNILGGLMQFFELPMSSMSTGPAGQAGLIANGISLAPMVCYEIVYPDLVKQWLPKADMLITLSNDAWFGSSIGPLQHLEMAQMRALENGRYLLRSTGTGVSAIIDHRGRIVERGDQFKREVIRGEAVVYQGSTPFAVTGSFPILIFSLLLCIGLRLFADKIRG